MIHHTSVKVGDLARLAGLPPNELFRLARESTNEYDRRITEDGRELRVPSFRLKCVQRQIYKRLLIHIPTHPCVHSVKGRSILSNARAHVRHPYIAILDIQDCFPSIGPSRVQRGLERVGFGDDVASLVTRLCTCDNQLPQGAPTSPVLVNYVLTDFDRKAAEMARRVGLTYTRYVDDITLSGGQRTLRLQKTLRGLLVEHRFRVAQHKCAQWGPDERKTVTGIVVNTKPNVSNEYRDSVRKLLVEHASGKRILTDAELASATGKIVFIKTVNPRAGTRLETLLLEARETATT